MERVVDGDTLELRGGERVRVLGIDTPEMKHPDPAVHALALRARDELARLAGPAVVLEPGLPAGGDSGPRPAPSAAVTISLDKYGRTLAYVAPASGTPSDAGAELLRLGLARPYPSPHARAAAYRELARRARAGGTGVWEPGVARVLGLVPAVEIDPGEAPSHVGALVGVTGAVTRSRRQPRVHPLTLRGERGELELVLFPSRYDEFPLEEVDAWVGRRLRVTGTISLHQGRPQIVLEDPFQVELVAAP